MKEQLHKKAIILFSGGLDSTTCLAIAKSQGYECYALSFNYHQRHVAELNAAKKIAMQFQVKGHQIIDIPSIQFAGSALTEKNISVPNFTGKKEIPITYVPARNTVFLAIALGLAEVLGAHDIFVGVSAVDYSNYPDCRPEFINAFQHLANLATKAGVEGNGFKIHAPLIHLSKAETIQLGIELGVDYGLTVSCYEADSNGEACGKCDSCTFRKKGFTAAGIKDPTIYS
jgi:7-cyano-7-deazaguanine synthase